ncbi:MAG: hypothetical protein LIO42_03465, partial [Oscillospiraceae bacterium]|nr:hypothetical protein [Oscillospiraceae bacterium]
IPEAPRGTPEIAYVNEQISVYNRMAEGQEAAARAASGKVQSIASKLEQLRTRMINTSYQEAVLSKGLEVMMSTTRQKETDAQEALSVLDMMLALNGQTQNTIAELMRLLEQTGSLQIHRRRELQEQISQEKKKVEDRSAYTESVMRQFGFSSAGEVRQAAQQARKQRAGLEDRRIEVSNLEAQSTALSQEYAALLGTVPASFQEELNQNRAKLRETGLDMPEGAKMSVYLESVRAVDRTLDPARQQVQQKTRHKGR